MEINGYELVNEDKLERAINGTLNSSAQMVGGVGKKDKAGKLENPEEVLAEYDRLGGLIFKAGTKDKVKTGSFYDFKLKGARPKPEVVYTYRVNGQEIDVPEGEELPLSVKAARIQEAAAGEDAGSEKPKKRRAK